MLQLLFSSKTRIRLLKLFFENPGRQLYLREIAKILNEPMTPIRRELLNLQRVGLLKRSRVANLIYYKIDNTFLLYHELKSIVQKTGENKDALFVKTNTKTKKEESPIKTSDVHAA